MESTEVEILVETFFSRLDENGDGKLQPQELQNLEEINSNPVFSRILKITERTEAGDVDFGAFKKNVLAFMGVSGESDKLAVFFRFYDADGDGLITKKDLEVVLGNTMELDKDDEKVLADRVAEIFNAFDTNGDGKIERVEFLDAAKKGGALELLV